MKKIFYTLTLIAATFALCIDMLAVQCIAVAILIFSLYKLQAFSGTHRY